MSNIEMKDAIYDDKIITTVYLSREPVTKVSSSVNSTYATNFYFASTIGSCVSVKILCNLHQRTNDVSNSNTFFNIIH